MPKSGYKTSEYSVIIGTMLILFANILDIRFSDNEQSIIIQFIEIVALPLIATVYTMCRTRLKERSQPGTSPQSYYEQQNGTPN
jgi:hypothetical protein